MVTLRGILLFLIALVCHRPVLDDDRKSQRAAQEMYPTKCDPESSVMPLRPPTRCEAEEFSQSDQVEGDDLVSLSALTLLLLATPESFRGGSIGGGSIVYETDQISSADCVCFTSELYYYVESFGILRHGATADVSREYKSL